MLGVIREIGERGKGGGDFGVVPERRFGFFDGVDDVVVRAFGGAVAVPEFVGESEPVRRDGEIEDELIDRGGKEASFESIVGGGDRNGRRGRGRIGGGCCGIWGGVICAARSLCSEAHYEDYRENEERWRAPRDPSWTH